MSPRPPPGGAAHGVSTQQVSLLSRPRFLELQDSNNTLRAPPSQKVGRAQPPLAPRFRATVHFIHCVSASLLSIASKTDPPEQQATQGKPLPLVTHRLTRSRSFYWRLLKGHDAAGNTSDTPGYGRCGSSVWCAPAGICAYRLRERRPRVSFR